MNQLNGNFYIQYLIQIRRFKKWINSWFKFEKNRMIRESIKILIDSQVNWQTLLTGDIIPAASSRVVGDFYKVTTKCPQLASSWATSLMKLEWLEDVIGSVLQVIYWLESFFLHFWLLNLLWLCLPWANDFWLLLLTFNFLKSGEISQSQNCASIIIVESI